MLGIFNPVNALEELNAFLVAGGNVLVVIMVVTFVLWMFVIERLLYFGLANAGVKKRAVSGWDHYGHSSDWNSLVIREKRISEVNQAAYQNFAIIKVLIAVLPLLGLLGTVTGMVEVFDVMASTGSSNARLMAGGITKATIPTMAGLVASLSGILMLNFFLDNMAGRTVREVTHDLEIGGNS